MWDDAENRAFIADKFAWFLPTFDGYKRNINRADAVRYFFLYYHGGVYADMDFECLKPIDPLLAANRDASVILGRMEIKDRRHSIPNAIMISKPRDPFWIYVFQQLIHNKNNPAVEVATGPIMLYEAVQAFNNKNKQPTVSKQPLFLLPVNRNISGIYNNILSNIGSNMAPHNATNLVILRPADLYPLSWEAHQDQRRHALDDKDYNAVTRKSLKLFPTAYTVTYWAHSW